jgi:hypothetical protein
MRTSAAPTPSSHFENLQKHHPFRESGLEGVITDIKDLLQI